MKAPVGITTLLVLTGLLLVPASLAQQRPTGIQIRRSPAAAPSPSPVSAGQPLTQGTPTEKVADKPPSVEVAKSLTSQFASQVELLLKLALAVSGGIAAIAFQLFFSKPQDERPDLRRMPLLFWSFICQCISIFLGYLAFGAIIGATINLFLRVDYSTYSTAAQIEHLTLVRLFEGGQFLFLLLGMTLIFAFLVANRDLIERKGKHMDESALTTLLAIAGARQQKPLRGYEQDQSFETGLKQITKQLAPLLRQHQEEVEELSELCTSAIAAYRQNQAAFEELYTAQLKASLNGKEPDRVAGEVLAAYLTAARAHPQLGVRLRRRTYIFPFC